jgi:hypothetical protein
MWTVMMASHPHGVVLRDNERCFMGGTWMPGLAGDARRSAAGRDDMSTRGWNALGAVTRDARGFSTG